MLVYRLVTVGGIEEKIYRRQIHKQGMNKATIEDEDAVSKYFSNTDLFELFQFEPETTQTLDLLRKQHDMTGLVVNPYVKSHVEQLESAEGVAGVSDNGVLYQGMKESDGNDEDLEKEAKGLDEEDEE